MFLNIPGSAVLKHLIFLYLSHSRVTAVAAECQGGDGWQGRNVRGKGPGSAGWEGAGDLLLHPTAPSHLGGPGLRPAAGARVPSEQTSHRGGFIC